MDLAMIGLGKMGLNMATRLVRGGHRVVGFAPSAEFCPARRQGGGRGCIFAGRSSRRSSDAPRVVWLMIPAGKVTDETIELLAALLEPGDCIIDGGNSNYKDTMRHAPHCLSGRGSTLSTPAPAAASGDWTKATA